MTWSIEESCGDRITKPWENVLAGKYEVGWVVDFGPWKSRRAGRAYHDSFVSQVLHSHVEKLVDSPGLYQTPHRTEEATLYSQGNRGHPNVSAAELISRYAFAHPDDSAIPNNHFHRFISPFRIHDHRNRSCGLNSRFQNLRVAKNICIEAQERIATEPLSRNPDGINIVRHLKLWVEKKTESPHVAAVSRAYVVHNLFALVTNNNPDLSDACGKETIDLVVENGFPFTRNQTLRSLAVNRPDSSTASRCKN
jgi:hypothetical protein